MTISQINATLDADINTVWRVITDTSHYCEWRSNLERVEAEDELHFSEYSRDGYATHFTVTQSHAPYIWEFSVENSNLTGRWLGVFEELGSRTHVSFTEYVTAKKFCLRPFVKQYLKKQQSLFVSDLKKALSITKERL